MCAINKFGFESLKVYDGFTHLRKCYSMRIGFDCEFQNRPSPNFMDGMFYINSRHKFYTKDGTEYTKFFENDRVVLGKNADGDFHTFRREIVFSDNPKNNGVENGNN